MAFEAKWDVYKIVAWKDGYVFKKIATIWLEVKPRTRLELNAIAQQYGGDELAPAIETRISK